MDAMLEEEMIDLITFCLQNPDSNELDSKKSRISEIGRELYTDGGVDAMENMFFQSKIESQKRSEKTPNHLGLYGMGIQKNGNIKKNFVN